MSDQTDQLAAAFIAAMQAALSPDQLAAIDATNRANPGAGWCASHDHLDANMVMEAAFKGTLGREPDFDTAHDELLWDAAWREAVARGFSTVTTKEA